MSRLLFIILLLHCISAKGDSHPLIDSLMKQLPGMKEDSNKVKALNNISFAYANVDPELGLDYAKKAEKLALDIGWLNGEATALAMQGINYSKKSGHVQALYYYNRALDYYSKLGLKGSIGGMLANIALIHSSQGNYPAALEFNFRALRLAEETGNKKTFAIVNENIGSIYLEQKNYPKTMQYYAVAYETYKKLKDKAAIARNLANIGIVHDARGNYKTALEYHQKALKTNKELGNKHGTQINYANLGNVYAHLKNYSEALKYHHLALKLSQELGNPASIAINKGNIGDTYFQMAGGKSGRTFRPVRYSESIPVSQAYLDSAINNLEKAVNICSEIHYYGPLIEFSKVLSDAYRLDGKPELALQTFKLHEEIKDSVFSEKNNIKFANLEIKRELDLKEKDLIIKNKQIEIAVLKEQKRRFEKILIISGSIILLVIMLFLLVRYLKRIRYQKNRLEEIAHIQAHDVRGPVARILGLAASFNQENPEDPFNKEIIRHMNTATQQLDEIVRKVVSKASD